MLIATPIATQVEQHNATRKPSNAQARLELATNAAQVQVSSAPTVADDAELTELRLRHNFVAQRIKLALIGGDQLIKIRGAFTKVHRGYRDLRRDRPAGSVPAGPAQPQPPREERLAAWKRELRGFEGQLEKLDADAWKELESLLRPVRGTLTPTKERSEELARKFSPQAGQTWLPTWLAVEQNFATLITELFAELRAADAADVLTLLDRPGTPLRFEMDRIYAALPIMRQIGDVLPRWQDALAVAESAAALAQTTSGVLTEQQEATPSRQIYYSAVPTSLVFAVGLPPQARSDATAAKSLAAVPHEQRAQHDDPPLGYLYTTVPGKTDKDKVAGAFPVLAIDSGRKTVELGRWLRNPNFADTRSSLEAQAAYAMLTETGGQAPGYQVTVQPEVSFRRPSTPAVLLTSQKYADLFVQKAVERLWPNWHTMDGHQRINAVKPLIDETLSNAGVPQVPVLARDWTDERAGEFSASHWTLGLSVVRANASNKLADFKEWVGIVYHEMFHAYQHMAIARLLFGLIGDDDELIKLVEIEDEGVLEAAKAKPLVAGAVAADLYLAAAMWWATSNSEPYKKHKESVADIRPMWAQAGVLLASHLYERGRAGTSAEKLQRTLSLFQKTETRTLLGYEGLPIEVDAFEVEKLIELSRAWPNSEVSSEPSGLTAGNAHIRLPHSREQSIAENEKPELSAARRTRVKLGGDQPVLQSTDLQDMVEEDLVWAHGSKVFSHDRVYLVVTSGATPGSWASTPWVTVHSAKPRIGPGQQLIRLRPTGSVGRWAAELARTAARMAARGVTQLPSASGHEDLLLPASVLTLVRVDKVYQPGQNVTHRHRTRGWVRRWTCWCAPRIRLRRPYLLRRHLRPPRTPTNSRWSSSGTTSPCTASIWPR